MEETSRAAYLGSFPLTVTVTTMGYRSYKNPLNKAPLRTVTGRGNDPMHTLRSGSGFRLQGSVALLWDNYSFPVVWDKRLFLP